MAACWIEFTVRNLISGVIPPKKYRKHLVGMTPSTLDHDPLLSPPPLDLTTLTPSLLCAAY